MSRWEKTLWTLVYLLIMVAPIFGQQRTVTLKTIAPKYDYTEAYLYTDSTEIKVGKKYLRYKPVHGRSVIGTVEGKGKRYKDGLNIEKSGGADIIRTKTDGAIKETVVIRDPAITSYEYEIKTNSAIKRSGDYLLLDGIGYIMPPVAWDADSNGVNTWFTYEAGVITYEWAKYDSLPVLVYPVYIDPTIIIKPDESAGKDANILLANPNANYGTTTSISLYNASGNPQWGLFQFDFSSIPSNATVSAVICSLYNNAAIASQNYGIYKALSYWDESTVTWNTRPTLSTTDTVYFTAGTGSAGWLVASGNSELNAMVQAWIADSSSNKGFLFRHRDSTSGSPTNPGIYTSDYTSDVTKRPSITVTYSALSNVYAANSLVFSSLTDSSARLDSIYRNPLDNGVVNQWAIYDYSTGAYRDTSQTAPFSKARKTYVHAAWKNKTWPFSRNYITQLIIEAFSITVPDSLKTTDYQITIGIPATGTNQGRWDPATDKIQ